MQAVTVLTDRQQSREDNAKQKHGGDFFTVCFLCIVYFCTVAYFHFTNTMLGNIIQMDISWFHPLAGFSSDFLVALSWECSSPGW